MYIDEVRIRTQELTACAERNSHNAQVEQINRIAKLQVSVLVARARLGLPAIVRA